MHILVEWQTTDCRCFRANMGKLLQRQSLVDMTLICSTHTMRVHKCVMAASSPYFDNITTKNKDGNLIVVLKEMSFDAMRSLVEFVYSTRTKIDEEYFDELTNAAQFLEVVGLKDVTRERLQIEPSKLPPKPFTPPQVYVRPSETTPINPTVVEIEMKKPPKPKYSSTNQSSPVTSMAEATPNRVKTLNQESRDAKFNKPLPSKYVDKDNFKSHVPAPKIKEETNKDVEILRIPFELKNSKPVRNQINDYIGETMPQLNLNPRRGRPGFKNMLERTLIKHDDMYLVAINNTDEALKMEEAASRKAIQQLQNQLFCRDAQRQYAIDQAVNSIVDTDSGMTEQLSESDINIDASGQKVIVQSIDDNFNNPNAVLSNENYYGEQIEYQNMEIINNGGEISYVDVNHQGIEYTFLPNDNQNVQYSYIDNMGETEVDGIVFNGDTETTMIDQYGNETMFVNLDDYPVANETVLGNEVMNNTYILRNNNNCADAITSDNHMNNIEYGEANANEECVNNINMAFQFDNSSDSNNILYGEYGALHMPNAVVEPGMFQTIEASNNIDIKAEAPSPSQTSTYSYIQPGPLDRVPKNNGDFTVTNVIQNAAEMQKKMYHSMMSKNNLMPHTSPLPRIPKKVKILNSNVVFDTENMDILISPTKVDRNRYMMQTIRNLSPRVKPFDINGMNGNNNADNSNMQSQPNMTGMSNLNTTSTSSGMTMPMAHITPTRYDNSSEETDFNPPKKDRSSHVYKRYQNDGNNKSLDVSGARMKEDENSHAGSSNSFTQPNGVLEKKDRNEMSSNGDQNTFGQSSSGKFTPPSSTPSRRESVSKRVRNVAADNVTKHRRRSAGLRNNAMNEVNNEERFQEASSTPSASVRRKRRSKEAYDMESPVEKRKPPGGKPFSMENGPGFRAFTSVRQPYEENENYAESGHRTTRSNSTTTRQQPENSSSKKSKTHAAVSSASKSSRHSTSKHRKK